MPRILAGRAKGRRLKAPRGARTRPTASRVRQVLFDILAPQLPGCRFLDALAGSGGVGLEALSRGASQVVFVDRSVEALAAVRRNVTALAAEAEVRIAHSETLKYLRVLDKQKTVFDFIYLDPPYESDLYEPLLSCIAASSLLDAGGSVVAEHFHKRHLPETIGHLTRTREVKVGEHRLSFYRVRASRRPE